MLASQFEFCPFGELIRPHEGYPTIHVINDQLSFRYYYDSINIYYNDQIYEADYCSEPTNRFDDYGFRSVMTVYFYEINLRIIINVFYPNCTRKNSAAYYYLQKECQNIINAINIICPNNVYVNDDFNRKKYNYAYRTLVSAFKSLVVDEWSPEWTPEFFGFLPKNKWIFIRESFQFFLNDEPVESFTIRE